MPWTPEPSKPGRYQSLFDALISIMESSAMKLWEMLDLVGKPLGKKAQSVVYAQSNVQDWIFQRDLSVEDMEKRDVEICNATEDLPQHLKGLFETLLPEQLDALLELVLICKPDADVTPIKRYQEASDQRWMQDFTAFPLELRIMMVNELKQAGITDRVFVLPEHCRNESWIQDFMDACLEAEEASNDKTRKAFHGVYFENKDA